MPDRPSLEDTCPSNQTAEYWRNKAKSLEDELDGLRTILALQSAELEDLRNPPVSMGTTTSIVELDPALKDQGVLKLYSTPKASEVKNQEPLRWAVGDGYDYKECYDTKEEAIREAKDYGYSHIAEAMCPMWPASVINLSDVLGFLNGIMEAPDNFEDWPNFTEDELKAVEQEMTLILKRHLDASGNWPPPFYEVGKEEVLEEEQDGTDTAASE